MGRNSGPANCQDLIDRFRRARRDPALAVLEGFHPLKHALRFGASVVETVVVDPEAASRLTQSLAPDLAGILGREAAIAPPPVFRQLSPAPPATGIVAIAQRPYVSLPDMLHDPAPAPVVLLENPRSHGNIGAAVRVAAAAGVAGLIAAGEHDPWHPAALVAAAGLHFALPVAWVENFPSCRAMLAGERAGRREVKPRPLVALDPEGEALQPGVIPEGAMLAFGAEREGLSRELLAAADYRVAIPMQPGVSSLNLATAVAVALYAWRWG